MKQRGRETLLKALEQLFVRVHGDLLKKIGYDRDEDDTPHTEIPYDPENEYHQELIKMCKDKIGFRPLATDRDMFYSIMRLYDEYLARERSEIEEYKRKNGLIR